MTNKMFATAVLMAILSVAAFGADDASIAKRAISLSDEIFAAKKDLTKKEIEIRDICTSLFNKKEIAIKDLNESQKIKFHNEFRAQMRKNIATLGVSEEFDHEICKKFFKHGKDKYGKMGGFRPEQKGGHKDGRDEDCPRFRDK